MAKPVLVESGVGVEGLKIILTYCLTECCKESQRVSTLL